MSQVEARLQELGYQLPEAPTPVAAYVPFVKTGSLVFISGQGCVRNGQVMFKGKVGREYSEEEGQEAARLCCLNLLAQLKKACDGDLDRVKRIVKLLGWVNCTDDFERQPWVINGASQLLEAVLGDKGRHARSAVSANALPQGITVEIEMVVEIE